jgi:hypothetical protein
MNLNGVDFNGFKDSLCQEFGIEKSATNLGAMSPQEFANHRRQAKLGALRSVAIAKDTSRLQDRFGPQKMEVPSMSRSQKLMQDLDNYTYGLDLDAAKKKIDFDRLPLTGKAMHYTKKFGVPALALGAAGLLGKIVYDQYQENKLPLSKQLKDPRTTLGSTASVVQGGGQLALAATMANEMIRTRQGEQYI